jgi:VWFA-related protein
MKVLATRRNKGGGAGQIGIYTFFQSGSLQVVQELTGDNELLSRAAKGITIRRPAYRDSGMTDSTLRVLEINDVLEAVARHLAEVPGRKNLVWISAGCPVVSTEGSRLLADFSPRMEQTARVLTDANLTFYSVDARGLIGSLSGATALANAESRAFGSPFQFPGNLHPGGWPPPGPDAFTRLADLTGGMAFHDNNGIEDSIQRALDDADLGYTLGFYPSQAGQSPGWHKLKVKVNQSGVRVRYRQKYFAPGALVLEDQQVALPYWLKAPLDATQLQLVAQATPDQRRPGFSRVRVSIDLHDLHLENLNNTWVGAFDVSFVIEGSRSARTFVTKFQIPNDQLSAALEKGVSMIGSIASDGGLSELRIVAQDPATGAAGSVRVPLGR